jgi:hypothetical protein
MAIAWLKGGLRASVADPVKLLSSLGLVLSNDQGAIAQREALAWKVGDRHIERGMAHRHARRSGDDPADMLVVPVPHFDAKRQMRGNVVQARICPPAL